MNYDFIVAGGGIAGLTAAIALQQEGYHVTVLERADELKEVGAGLGLGANAWKALRMLGVMDELEPACHHLKEIEFLNQTGEKLNEIDIEKLNQEYGVAYFTVHRAQLQKVLAQHLHVGTLQLGKRIVQVEQSGAGVTVHLEDGTTEGGNALIAADGIHSTIRNYIVPDVMLRYSGYTCWRAVIDAPPNTYMSGVFTETWGANGRIGIVPLTNNQLYWFACVNAPFRSEKMNDYTTEELLHHFQDYHFPIPELLKWTNNERLFQNDVIDLKPMQHFAFDNILLIGDAAHAMTPNMGQGASQAIEDALVLRQAVNNEQSIEKAFISFEQERLPKTTTIVNGSWRVGQAAQMDKNLPISIRNAVMRMTPSKMLERQLKHAFRTNY